MPANKAVLFEVQGPMGGVRLGAVLRGTLAEEVWAFVDSFCIIFGLPAPEWEETESGLVWRHEDQARGVKAEARVTPWGLREEG